MVKKKSSEIEALASQMVKEVTEEQPAIKVQPQKNVAAVELGRLGELKGRAWKG